MRKITWGVLALVILTASACSTESPTPTFTPAPRATWTATVKPASASSASAASTASSGSSSPIPTVAAITVPAPNTATPVSTATPAPTAAPTIPPGLYVSDLRIDPNPPTRGTDLIFFATFVNATGTLQNYKWLVYIYRPEVPTRSFSETTAGLSAIPVGTNELKSNGSWKIAIGGPCENFIARPAFLDQNNQPVFFTAPDGKAYQKEFTVCAPSDLPPGTPRPSPTPTPTPTFAPGLFVMDIRTEPNPPKRGSELQFYVTFANTIGSLQTVKWNVYIYRPGEKNSYGETTSTTTTLGIGINEYNASGYWKLPLGGPCEDFVVRVGWFDSDHTRLFTVFENQVFEKTLLICPP